VKIGGVLRGTTPAKENSTTPRVQAKLDIGGLISDILKIYFREEQAK
jgi:hypothetical protein